MTWFKLDDGFYDHPKVADLPDSAVALWARAASYCMKHLTDGAVPARTARRLVDNFDEAIVALLKSGLWEEGDAGYVFHDWAQYQPSRAEVLAAAQKKSSGGALGNHKRWHTEMSKTDPRCAYCPPSSNRSSDRSTDRSTDRTPDRVSETVASRPTRPGPTRPEPLSSKSKSGGVDLSSSLPKQDQSEVSKTAPTDDSEVPYFRRSRKRWCEEHGHPNDRDCTGCHNDHGDAAYWSKLPEGEYARRSAAKHAAGSQ